MSQEKEFIPDQKHYQLREYRCFCAKNYNSYAGLYLHLKSKHQDAFAQYKNMKISKLLTPLNPDGPKLVFKLKQPSKDQDQPNNSFPQKAIKSNRNIISEVPAQKQKQKIKEQPFYVNQPQFYQYPTASYYHGFQPQPHMQFTQSYIPVPVKDYPVFNNSNSIYSSRDQQFYQYPMVMGPTQAQMYYPFTQQNIPASNFLNNGMQYWHGALMGRQQWQRTLYQGQRSDSRIQLFQLNQKYAQRQAGREKQREQKNKQQQKKGKCQLPNSYNLSEQSTKKSFNREDNGEFEQKGKKLSLDCN